MINLVGCMTTNLLTADLYSRCSNTALGVYAVAKAKGDTSTMERAIGYAGDANATANDAAGKIDDDLREAIKKARAEEKEKAREAQDAREAEKAEKTDENSGNTKGVSSGAQDSYRQKTDEIPETGIAEADIPPAGSYSDCGVIETIVPSGATIDIQG